MNQPAFAVIAGGYLPQNDPGAGQPVGNVLGCTAISGGTGVRQVTLNNPHRGVTQEDVLIQYNLGLSTGTGDASIGASSITNGTFLIFTYRAGVLSDLNSYFTVSLIPKDK